MTAARGERHLASHAFNLVVLAVGGVALVFLMKKLGWDNARHVFRDVGSWFAVIVALDLAVLACDAAAIHAFMRPEARMAGYWRVLAAQAGGRAVNLLTPGGALGEATKVSMLVSHAPRARVVSSIVLFDLAGFYLSVVVMIIGIPITAALVDLPHDLSIAVWVGLGILVSLVIAIGIAIHRGALATTLDAARTLRFISPERRARWKVKLADFDQHLRELHTDRSPGTRLGLALVGLSRLGSWTASAVALHAVGVTLDPIVLVGVFSAGVLLGWIASLVPFGIGILDGGNYALFDVLGASGAHGVFVTMLGRARNLVSALIGLAVMAAGHAANRVALARRHRLIASLEAVHGSESPSSSS